MTDPAIIIDVLEYEAAADVGNPDARSTVKYGQIYQGVEERRSDGITCLSLLAPGASRRHNIEVSAVRAITIRGSRYIPESPRGRWKLRAQELVMIIEGDFSEEWAREYFDPSSPKWYGAEEEVRWDEPEIEPARPMQARLHWSAWKLVTFAIVVGYLLGRFRLIKIVLKALSVRRGLWL